MQVREELDFRNEAKLVNVVDPVDPQDLVTLSYLEAELGALSGVVTSVTGTAPIVSSGGAAPVISIDPADTDSAGSMSSSHWNKLQGIEAGAEVNDTAAEILAKLITVDGSGSGLDADTLDGSTSADFVTKALYDANSLVIAVLDNTPVALPMAASTIPARLASGDIIAATPTQIRTLLNVQDGATDDQTAAEILTALLTVDTNTSGLNANTLQGSTLAQVISDTTAAIVDSAPGTLDTLNELAAALGDDPNFATTITNALATKPDKFAGTYGNGALTTITVNHALATEDIASVTVRLAAGTKEVILCDWRVVDSNNITIGPFNVAPTTNELRVVVTG